MLILPCSLTSSGNTAWQCSASDKAIVDAVTELVMDLRGAQTEVPQQIIPWPSHDIDCVQTVKMSIILRIKVDRLMRHLNIYLQPGRIDMNFSCPEILNKYILLKKIIINLFT
jgi:hypothetical protein